MHADGNGDVLGARVTGGPIAVQGREGRAGAIRAAALALFAARGYQATTMADIGAAVGIRGPSLYKHVGSKQELLRDLMTGAMNDVIALHRAAVNGAEDVAERLRRATETHVRYHARHRLEAFVGTQEIRSLEEPNRAAVLRLRDRYERAFRDIVAAGVAQGRFSVVSVRLASYAILDLGMGVAVWYREDGDVSEDELVYQYGRFALRLVGA